MKYTNMIPKKWFIRHSPEVLRLFKEWMPEDIYKEYTSSWTKFNYPNWNTNKGFKVGYHTGSYKGYTEISIEEFEQYVLKQDITYEIY